MKSLRFTKIFPRLPCVVRLIKTTPFNMKLQSLQLSWVSGMCKNSFHIVLLDIAQGYISWINESIIISKLSKTRYMKVLQLILVNS